uniref:Ubiquitin-like protease family profile domain-containing protein n=1 Tax=Ditylenchus dipsaci TaxID=166011 RepID=A0A915DX45_9BILA
MREFLWTNSDVIEWLQGLKDKLVSLTEVMQFFKDEFNVTKGERAIYNHMPKTTCEEVFIDKDERSQINPLLPKVYAFNTNFFNKLKRNAASAMRWTMKVDLQSFDIILVPIHLPGHWALSIMDMRRKGMYYFDSMLGDGRDCLRELREFLVLESVAKRGKAFNTMDWTFLSVKTIPTQMNGSDCGVFLCRCAECIARDADTDFKAADMNEFRKKIVQGIKSGKLI